MEVPVADVGGERELGVDLGGDSAGVAEDELDVFEAESFGAENRGERVPCGVRAALLLDTGGLDGLVVPPLQGPDRWRVRRRGQRGGRQRTTGLVGRGCRSSGRTAPCRQASRIDRPLRPDLLER